MSYRLMVQADVRITLTTGGCLRQCDGQLTKCGHQCKRKVRQVSHQG